MADRRRFFSSFEAAQAPAPLASGAFLLDDDPGGFHSDWYGEHMRVTNLP